MDWCRTTKKDFKEIKWAIINAPVLVRLDYTKLFYWYSFASDHTCATILTHRIEEEEHPVALMSAPRKMQN